MVCGVLGSGLAIVLFVIAWIRTELSFTLKLILTGIYGATWLAGFLDPWAMWILHGVFALGLYFFLFPSGRGRRWRP
jgi:hypothetical protein